jgi:hypothetical protein
MASGLLIVGGYGLVGEQVARLLRQRHPDLPLVLGGRHPERAKALAASIGAETAAVDVGAPQPLASLTERPAAVLAAVSDPDDHLLVDAMRRGIPFADINRAGHSSILDVTVAAARERPSAPVLLSGGWFAGVSALMAAAAVRELGDAERVDIAVLASSDDRVGPDSWGFSDRLAWPYYAMRGGRRHPAHPLTGLRTVRCADLQERPAALVGTLEQTTLPVTLGVPTVETRMALQSVASLYGLVGLKRTGALRALARPGLRRVRAALLQRPGSGDFAGITVTATGPSGSVSVDLLDAKGQAHLSAVGAACAAERVLGSGLPAGVSFPEQSADPEADLELLRQAGVVVRLNGFGKDVPHAQVLRRDVGGDGARRGRMRINRSDTPALLLCALRAVGAAAFLAPGVGAKKLGIPDDADGTYLVRLFAARNVALAGGLLASRGEARRLWYQAGIACDALDVAAGLLGFRAGKERSAAMVDTSASLVATALGVAGLVMDRRAKKAP